MRGRGGQIAFALVLLGVAPAAAQPTVAGFSPTSGPPGTSVTVSGLDFDPRPFATEVAFGGVVANPFAVHVHASGASLTATVPAGAVSGPITVTTGVGSGSSAGLLRPAFIVSDAPVLVGLFPTSGVAGQVVRLYGRGLLTVDAVVFTGGARVVPPFFVRVDAAGTVVEAAVPTGARSGPITVITSGGSASTAALDPPGAFLIDQPPNLDAFYPASGPPGATVIVHGENLFDVASVRIGGAAAPIARIDDSGTSIEVVVPGGAATGVIAVETPHGGATTAGLDEPAFVVDTVPRIDEVYPSSADVGARVTIRGVNFGMPAVPPFLPSENVVRFGAIAWDVLEVDRYRTSITARVAVAPAASAPITVTTAAGTAVSPDAFTVSSVPVVTGFQPGSGMPGARITVIGRNLSRATVVTFDRMPTTDVRSDAAGTSLDVAVPLGATSGAIAVTTPGGTASTGLLVPPRLFIVTRGSACGDGQLDPGEACDDGNLAPGDCCDARCRIVASGTPCSDGVFCNGADACDGGTCSLHAGDPCSGAAECRNACTEATRSCLVPADTPCGDDGDLCSDDVCDGDGTCAHPVRPRTTCKAPVGAGAARLELLLRKRAADNRLTWTLARGAATTVAELGDPAHATSYAFCLFDGTDALLWRADVPPGGMCDGRPCWRQSDDAVTYHDPARAIGGLRRITVTAARAGRARAAVVASGTSLGLPALPITSLPLTAQLRNDAGACWSATYDTAVRNRRDAFVARTDTPPRNRRGGDIP